MGNFVHICKYAVPTDRIFGGMTPVSDSGSLGILTAPNDDNRQGLDALSAHRRPGYPSPGCVPAEPDSVSPGIRKRDRIPTPVKCLKTTLNNYFGADLMFQLPTRFPEEPFNLSIDFRIRLQTSGQRALLTKILKWLAPLVMLGVRIYHELGRHC